MKHNISICLPKTRGRPRLDGTNEQPEDYYRHHLLEPFLKKFILELEAKFTENIALSGFTNLMYKNDWKCDAEIQNKVKLLINFYKYDVKDSLENICLEIEMWQKRLQSLV